MPHLAGCRHLHFWRPVVSTPEIVPLFDSKVVGICGLVGIQWFSECERHSIGIGLQSDGKVDGTTGVADALQTAILDGARHPALHADDIQLTVLRSKATTHHPGIKLHRKLDRSPLDSVTKLFANRQKHATSPKREVQQLSL